MQKIEYLKKLKSSPILRDLEWAKCHDDPYYWLTNWAYTLDAHDPSNPEKPFPKKDYIKIIVEKWLKNQILFIPKSRQMMISWIFCALYLWDAQFHFGRLNFFQSKKADDANDLIKRAKLIWDNEPAFLKRYNKRGKFLELKCNPQNQGQHIYNLLTFPDIKSEIRGVPEGGDVVRMHTLTGIFSDEACFQPEMESAFTALKPTLSSGGKLTCVSTPEDGTWFEDAVFDMLEM
jgi:hypothetical protein